MNNNNTVKNIKRCGTICVKNIFGAMHLLVVRGKATKIWSLPKGSINEGESELSCAQRETLEETGLFLPLSSNQRVCINQNVYFIVPIARHTKLKIRDKNEVDKVNWITLPDLKTLECNKDLRSILATQETPVNRSTLSTLFHSLMIAV